ncbi:triphosphoribosyl-dephospho-CoA synthase MdcB [Agrobacterium rubi]|nr:triphosphoribosyl-dephospho-CoA synthase MdcB [Agrobacterium rubi]MBP1880905.1 triphosphoribosyl-dephospho-CoA synthase [Agrobacterium rubi]
MRMMLSSIIEPQAIRHDISRTIGRLAIRALYTELALYPKPGLVSPVDNGAHDDMTMATFMRSLFSLRSYFPQIATAGGRMSDFAALQKLGIDAERRMMAATGGINTHRGAIFNLGLLAAAAGYRASNHLPVDAKAICTTVSKRWGVDILASEPIDSNGSRALARHGGDGARQQAAGGYAVLRDVALPAFRDALALGASRNSAALQTFFAIMSVLNDTNILHRTGRDGLDYVQGQARTFLSAGGVFAADHLATATDLHHAFCARRISPGGAADLLSCTIFLHYLEASP